MSERNAAHRPRHRVVVLVLVAASSSWVCARDSDLFPIVPPDVEVTLFAKEPLVRNPCAIAFDARGRLCVGMGPQYRHPTPETPGDSVWLLIDETGDGVADARREFATGFNAIQGLAWRGRDLWVANSPDLTIVRDLDGDDEADEYVRVWTDLGNLEHALHGLRWAPDGKLYMSKGNSKGLTKPPDRIAPRAFRELWGVDTPDLPEAPPPIVYTKAAYRHNFHDPSDDWGREGGILRCDESGEDLEIFARGFRNPWDIAFDDDFQWLGTDNDQTEGDKIFSPFYGAHFGWGHTWSYDWRAGEHVPTVPANGPFFEGSGTGVVFCGLEHYPERYRDVFLLNDWLRREVLIYRPTWDGARMMPRGGELEVLAHAGGGRSMAQSSGRSFDPVDIEIGPDGAIYISSWGREYGATYRNGEISNEGRIYRLTPKGLPPLRSRNDPKRERPLGDWSIAELVEDFSAPLTVWRTNAQNELLGREDHDPAVRATLERLLSSSTETSRSRARSTWAAWTLGRMQLGDGKIDDFFADIAAGDRTLGLRLQAIRILGARGVSPPLSSALRDPEPRMRLEALAALRQRAGAVDAERREFFTDEVVALLAEERDPIVFYAGWGALRALASQTKRRRLLADERPAVRRAAFLSLLEDDALSETDVRERATDDDEATRALASRWLGERAQPVVRGRPLRAPRDREGKERPNVSFIVIHEIATPRGSGARLEVGTLDRGERVFVDRAYSVTALPEELRGEVFLRTANDDAESATAELEFRLGCEAEVFVAHDTRIPTPPAWLSGFAPTGLRVETDDARFRVFRKLYPEGEVHLGPNADDGQTSGRSQYFVVVRPKLFEPQTEATSVEDVVPLLSGANRARGRDLFHSKHGARCHACHRLEAAGKAFAPDLSGIASRADASYVIRSIIDPSAAITEGFASQVFVLGDGEVLSGLVLEETAGGVKVADANGDVHGLPRGEIVSRRSTETSAMPSFAEVLSARDVADLAAYVLAAPPQTDIGIDLEHIPEEKIVAIKIDGRKVATYHYGDSRTRRPFVANIRTSGESPVPVTRSFPPVDGIDATDHAGMHPGLWLAFGDIDGADVWRLKARVESASIDEFRTGKDRASFRVRNRYIDGERILCEEICTHSIIRHAHGYFITYDSTFSSSRGDLSFGDQEEMGLGVRVATPITGLNGGRIENSEGGEQERGTWGRAADWLDYRGKEGSREVGVTLMNHPKNFRRPWFHTRDYGLAVLNPFGREAMHQGPKSKVVVRRGDELRFRAGAFIHDLPERTSIDIDRAFESFVKAIEAE